MNLTNSKNLGLGAVLNVAKPKKGASVAVFGLGAVGLAVSFRQTCLRFCLGGVWFVSC